MRATHLRRTAVIVSTLGMLAAGSVALTSPALADTSCASAWSASTAYSGGSTASENGTNYRANWWTQGDDPATHSGASGSGQPWTSTGSCTGGGTTTPPGGGGTTTPPSGGGTGSADGLLFSPYKDITVNLDWNSNVMSTAVTGSRIPVAGSSDSLVATREPNLGAITLAFATGTCGSENWGGVPADAFIAANIHRLDSAGLDYVVSTGGAAGSFHCASGDALKSFIAKYATSHLVGIDYDIESGQSASDIQSLVAASAAAQSAYPDLRFSFTLATLAASDGSYGGLNGTGDTVMKAIASSGLANYTINLMVMDYGRAGSQNCVLSGSTCEMGASAIQAAQNLQHSYGTPYSKVELTPMIGVNDASDEVFTLADVDTVTSWATAHSLAGLHFWSLDRDTPCPSAQSTASPTCNSVSGSSALQWTDRFLHDLGR